MQRITEFESVRGLMAFWVVLGHTCSAMALKVPAPLPQNLSGRTAVDVFIILSGFVIALLLVEKKEVYGIFIIRRFFRLAPVYLICLIVSTLMLDFAVEAMKLAPEASATDKRLSLIAIAQGNLSAHLTVHAIMLHGLFGKVLPAAAYTIIGQAWSISVEWQFYLFAPLVIATFWYRNLRAAVVSISIFFVISKIGAGGGAATSHAVLFAIGIFYYRMWANVTIQGEEWPLSHIRALSLSMLFVGLIVLKKHLAVTLWVCFAHVTFVRARTMNNSTPEMVLSGLLLLRPLVYLGKMSFSVYLTHMIVLYPVLYISARFEPLPQAVLLLIGVSVGTLVLSSATYHWVEKPGIRLGAAIADIWRARYSCVGVNDLSVRK